MGNIFAQPNQHSPPNAAITLTDEICLNPSILAHPLFLQSNDEVLSTIIESLKSLVRSTQDTAGLMRQNQRFDACFARILDDGRGESEIRKDFEKINESNTTCCWNVIPKNEIFFRCLDCEICDENTISLQCQECFSKVNHEGHRILKGKTLPGVTYTCDCGRPDMIKEQAFCPKHQHKEQTLEEALQNFPQAVREKYTDISKKVVYGIVCLFEIREKAHNKRVQTLIDALLQNYIEKMLRVFCFFPIKVSKSFFLVLEDVMQSTFDSPHNMVWHDCDDLKDHKRIKDCDVQQYRPCTCSILGCLLRFSRCLHKTHQAGINQVLVGCSSEKRFQSFLYKEAYRYVSFLLGNPALEDDDPNKNNSTLIKLISAGRLLEENEIGYLQNLVAALRRTVDGYLSKPTVATLEGILHIGLAIVTFLDTEAKVSEVIVEKTNLLNELLDLLAKFKANSAGLGDVKLGLFEHNIDYRKFNQSCTMERCLYEPIEHGLKKIGKLGLEKRDYLSRDIAKAWYNCFQDSKMALDHQRLYKGEISTVAGLERVFSSIVLNNIDDITKENVEGFLTRIFKDTYPSNLAANTVGGVLNTLGVMRFTDILLSSQPNIPKVYYNTSFSIFETDMLLIQLMTMLVRPEELFSLFTTKFFSYSQELKDFCLSLQLPQSLADHPHSRQMTLALEDYLKFLIYLMNDELSLTNILLKNKLNRACSASQLEKICGKLLRNILVTRQWTDISRVKAILHLFVFDNNLLPTDNIISKITSQDDKNHKIKLKEEYITESDPYMFYKFYYFQREEQNLLATTDKKDIVSGKFYTDLPVYLKTVQHNIFQSQLPQFLSHMLNNFSNEISRLLQPALKLVLFNLQVMNESLENPTNDNQGLKKNIEQYYLDKRFSESLNKILAQEDYKECEPCIQNIQDLIKKLTYRLSSRHQSPDKSSVREMKESAAEEKKRLAKEKMEKMKQQFAKKQALFAEKNEELLVKSPAGSQETDKEEEKLSESDELVCQYCLDKISQEASGEDYGFPIYVEFTNNFYKTGEQEVSFEEQDYSDLNKAKWWPVISSCNHFYHRRCFDLHFQNSRGPQNLASKLFMNEYETQCALCKTLCNNFLVMNKDQTSENSSQYNLEFALKIQNLLTHLRDKLVLFQSSNNQNQHSDVPLEEILRRTYEYFTESFYLYEKPQALEDAMKVQVSFARAFKSFAHNENKKTNENISFLKTVNERLKGETSEKINLEQILKSLFFDLLQEKPLTSESEPEQGAALVQQHIKLIQEYVAVNLVAHASAKISDQTQLQDILAFYKENNEMLDNVAAELLFPLEKILLTYCLNKSVLGIGKSPKVRDFCETLLTYHDGVGSSKLDLLLKQVQIPLTFEKLVEQSLSLLETLPQSEYELLENKKLNIEKLKLAPRYVNLPETYMEFMEKYIRQKCKICDKHNINLLHNICLICGEPMCAFQCNAANNNDPGNLSKHASKYHMGLGLFYGVDHHAVTVIKNDIGLLFEIGSGYTDELGQYLRKIFMTSGPDSKGVPRNLEFKKFKLDEKTYDFVRKIVNNHRMGKEIFERTLQNPQGFVGMYRF